MIRLLNVHFYYDLSRILEAFRPCLSKECFTPTKPSLDGDNLLALNCFYKVFE